MTYLYYQANKHRLDKRIAEFFDKHFSSASQVKERRTWVSETKALLKEIGPIKTRLRIYGKPNPKTTGDYRFRGRV